MRFRAPAIALQVKHGRSPQAAQSIPTYGACLIFSCIALPPLALVMARVRKDRVVVDAGFPEVLLQERGRASIQVGTGCDAEAVHLRRGRSLSAVTARPTETGTGCRTAIACCSRPGPRPRARPSWNGGGNNSSKRSRDAVRSIIVSTRRMVD